MLQWNTCNTETLQHRNTATLKHCNMHRNTATLKHCNARTVTMKHLQHWNTATPKHCNTETLRQHWTEHSVQRWNTATLKHCNTETLQCWNTIQCCNAETMQRWNTATLKHYIMLNWKGITLCISTFSVHPVIKRLHVIPIYYTYYSSITLYNLHSLIFSARLF